MNTNIKTNSTTYIKMEIIEDEADYTEEENIKPDFPLKKTKEQKNSSLLHKYFEENNIFEIGVDEVGRGPMFGRVYTAAVILPKDDSFDHYKMKDSKKFSSTKKIEEASNYIKENAIAWYISFENEKTIDEINILQATQKSMHHCITEVRKLAINKLDNQLDNKLKHEQYSFHALIDGNYFKPLTIFNTKTQKLESVPYHCIEGGDNKYSAIAAASILAKVERDKYIHELCETYPELNEKYSIDSNKGYGAKKHLDGIKEHGITIWHRRSFGICKNYV